jgi:hypothetical protein
MKQFAKGIITMMIMLLIFLPISVYAKIPKISDIPNNIPEQERIELMQQRDVLLKRRDSLKAKVNTHNQKCRDIQQDSPLKEECQREQRDLQNEVESYASDVRNFNSEVVAAGASIPLFEDSEFPDIDRLLLGVQRIRVPPPIPPQDVAIRIGQLAPNDKTSKRILLGLEAGVVVMDIIGKLGGVVLGGAVLPAKFIIATGKSFIAAENAADVYLVKQTEIYEQASVYLRDPKTRLHFTEIVRAIKENKPVPEDADVQMLRAAQAILDPKLGNSGMRIAWEAMFSPGARRAAATQACIELGGFVFGKSVAKGASGAAKVTRRVASVQKPPFIKAIGTITTARKMLEKATSAKERAGLQEVIKVANKKAEGTYRTSPFFTEERAEKLIEGGFDILFKHEAEAEAEIKNH